MFMPEPPPLSASMPIYALYFYWNWQSSELQITSIPSKEVEGYLYVALLSV